jgi:exopolyphosphatase / guanosine-5'-triphosphate,3'-diphosphate pyrophosphatase
MKEFPLYGALDIGSNAARILFANVIPLEKELFIYKNSLLRLPLRLGEDVYSMGKLSPKKIRSLIDTCKVFESLIRIYQPVDFAVYATAAIREAENSSEVMALLKQETGFEVHVIDGYEEARIIKELHATKGSPDQYKLMADLGGGSLEFTVVSPGGNFISESFKIGAVRALKSGISESEIFRMRNWLQKQLPADRTKVYFIGTGGNINTMKSTFTSPTVDYMMITEIKKIFENLNPLSVSSRIKKFNLRPDRADVIVPAAEIFYNLMRFTDIQKVFVPGGGLSDGIVLELHKRRTHE